MYSSDDSVTVVSDDLKKGDRAAFADRWNRYFDSHFRKTRWKLETPPRPSRGGEGVLQRATESHFRVLGNDRDDSWQTASQGKSVIRPVHRNPSAIRTLWTKENAA